MFKKLLLAIVAVIAFVLVFALTKPDTFSVERSTAIKAPPDVILAQLTDFHKWEAWSPWEKMDPSMKHTYSGAPNGVGAIYAWEGDSAVGQGRMEIKGISSSAVAIQLDFTAPMKASNLVDFSLTPKDDATNVSWRMTGGSNYLSKLMQVFMSMDSMVGKDFESGLADLKRAAENAAAQAMQTTEPSAP
jgi:carbon monoxide dehydrogenase subunit G